MSGPFWRVGGLRTLAAKVLDLYSRTRHLFGSFLRSGRGVSFSCRSGVTFGYTFFPISFGLGTGVDQKKKKERWFGWLVWFGLGWVDFWRLDFCFIFSSQSWFHFFWANIGGGQKKKGSYFLGGGLFFLKISSGGPFDLPVYSSLCTFWTMVFCFSSLHITLSFSRPGGWEGFRFCGVLS